MTDTNAPGVMPAPTPAIPDTPSPWPHYIAGVVVLLVAAGATYVGKLSPDSFSVLLFGAAAAVGFKMQK